MATFNDLDDLGRHFYTRKDDLYDCANQFFDGNTDGKSLRSFDGTGYPNFEFQSVVGAKDQIEMDINAITLGGDDSAEYHFKYSDDGGSTFTETTEYTHYSTGVFYNYIDDLEVDQTYIVDLYCKNDFEVYDVVDSITVTTRFAPVNLGISDNGDGTVTASWDHSSNHNGESVYLEFKKNGVYQYRETISSSNTSHTSNNIYDDGDTAYVDVGYEDQYGNRFESRKTNTITIDITIQPPSVETVGASTSPNPNYPSTDVTFTGDLTNTGGESSERYIEYRSSGSSNWNQANAGSTNSTGEYNIQRTFSIGGDYDFRAKATNSQGADYGSTKTVYVYVDDGGGSCLVEGSQVTLSNGEQTKIENLSVGDQLLSADIKGFEDTNDVSKLYQWSGDLIDKKDVTTTIKEITAERVESIVSINSGEFKASSPHSQLIKRDENWIFVPLKMVQEGDFLIKEDGEQIKIQSVELIEEPTTVYKMTLDEPYHTFYGNKILTHNVKRQ